MASSGWEKLSKEEKRRLLLGRDLWYTCDFDGKIDNLRMADASLGMRIPLDPKTAGPSKPSVSYPSAQVLASTWNLDLVSTYAECVADDCLEAGADVILGPGINLKRNPLCGRNFEYYSEDPFLAGTLAYTYIQAAQKEGAGTCVKHFFANNSEENRHHQSSVIDERALHEVYLLPFEMALKAKPVSLMCSYNRINGIQASENREYFAWLRKEGFDGMIVSDWGAVNDPGKSINAGLDLIMPYDEEQDKTLAKEVGKGLVSEAEIDTHVARIKNAVERVKSGKPEKVSHSLKERIEFTRTVEEEGIVLLKNDGVLPLKKRTKVAVSGLYARPDRDDFISGGGSAHVDRLTPLPDIPSLLSKRLGTSLSYEPAFDEINCEASFFHPENAYSDARKSDVSLVFCGTGARIESEGFDRLSLRLSPRQERTILTIAGVSKKTVVVLFTGSAVDMSAWIDAVDAVLYVGFPGEKGAEAIADVLTGEVNPSGKLTETFPNHLSDTPAYKSPITALVSQYSEGIDIGYRYYERNHIPVLFPFGFGLSYSTFSYSDLRLAEKGGKILVSYRIRNTSEREGKEVSQVYVQSVSPKVYMPPKILRGFAKTLIAPGESEEVEVELSSRSFQHWSTEDKGWVLADGDYRILVGSSSKNIRLRASLRVREGRFEIL